MKIWNIQYKKLKDILLLVGLDLIAIGASTALSLLIVNMQIDIALSLLYWFLINIAVTYLFFALFKLYTIVFTSVGLVDSLRALCATLCIFCVNVACGLFLGPPVGFRVCSTYCILLFIFVLLIRFSKRIYIALRYSISRKSKGKIRAMIVGGGNAGSMLIREIQTTDKIDYIPICVVDDDPAKLNKNVN